MNLLNNKQFVEKTPLLSVVLIEYGNLGQIYRMWHEHSALGQNLSSWISVGAALLLWLNFYRVNKHPFAYWATVVGILLNAGVWLSVLYFRIHG